MGIQDTLGGPPGQFEPSEELKAIAEDNPGVQYAFGRVPYGGETPIYLALEFLRQNADGEVEIGYESMRDAFHSAGRHNYAFPHQRRLGRARVQEWKEQLPTDQRDFVMETAEWSADNDLVDTIVIVLHAANTEVSQSDQGDAAESA